MTDPTGLADAYQKSTVFDPDHLHKLELEVTRLEAQEAANAILAYAAKLQF